MRACLICERIQQIQDNTNPHFVAELATGYVVLGDYQFFHGYTLFLAKAHVAELHELSMPTKERFLIEMSLVAEAVFRAFRPRKLNYECLGNAEPHLHWHLFPRYADDPSPGTSSWKIDHQIRYAEQYRLEPDKREQIKQCLLAELRQQPGMQFHRL